MRSAPDTITALPNVCLHRGTRLADGAGHVADGSFRCPFHGWRYALDGRVIEVVDAGDFDGIPDDLALCSVRAERWGGFVFINFDPDAEPLLDFLDPLPKLFDAYHFDQMKFRSYLTTVIPANWKVVVDAFNEAYHVQTGHEQVLPWTDDVSIVYENLGNHSHYGRLTGCTPKAAAEPASRSHRRRVRRRRRARRDGHQPRWRVPCATKRRSSPSCVRPIFPMTNCSAPSKTDGGSCWRRAASTSPASNPTR